ncbi:MAG: response regulator transcription factor [Sinimarinibacterium flocculans]|uniref:response regulator transcription factor n=1 Tax=Sinimarinibacterium flocculans TaxID=985250 RepID=UPI003C68DEB0
MTERLPATTDWGGPAHESWDAREPLSERELEVLRYVAGGWSNREIARALALTDHTIKWHLKNIYAKLGVNGRVCAVLAVREQAQRAATATGS